MSASTDTIRKLKGIYWRMIVNGVPDEERVRFKLMRALIELANAPIPPAPEIDTTAILAMFR